MTGSQTVTRSRRNGEGSIRRRPDGRYEVRYWHEGRRRSRYAATEQDARAVLTAESSARDMGAPALDRRTTVAQLLGRWYAIRETAARQTTLASYRSVIALVGRDPIGRVRLHELAGDDVARFIARAQRAGRQTSTIRTYHSVLRAALDYAVASGAMLRNPATLVQLPKRGRRETTVPTAADVRAILTAAAGRDRYALAYALGAMAGLRMGEVQAIRWRDLDLGRGVVRVRASWAPSTGPQGVAAHYGPTKSSTSVRDVPMMAGLAELVVAHARRDLAPNVRPHPDAFVFAGPDHGRPVTSAAIREGWRATCKLAGVGPFRFHDLRHAFAVYCLDHAIAITTVSAWLGHSGIGITVDTYGHRDKAIAPAPPSMLAQVAR